MVRLPIHHVVVDEGVEPSRCPNQGLSRDYKSRLHARAIDNKNIVPQRDLIVKLNLRG